MVVALLCVNTVLSQQNGGKNVIFPSQDTDNHSTRFRLSEPVRNGFGSEIELPFSSPNLSTIVIFFANVLNL